MRAVITLLIAMIGLSSCVYKAYYDISKPSYEIDKIQGDFKSYKHKFDGLMIQVYAVNKQFGNFYISMKLHNNRDDSVFVDLSGLKIWHRGGQLPAFFNPLKGEFLREQIILCPPEKYVDLLIFQDIREFSNATWIDTVYVFLGQISDSWGYHKSLDTLRFVLSKGTYPPFSKKSKK